jgi:RNA polymerase-associated protein RTF1
MRSSSTASHHSLQSASMSESESDAESPPAGDDGPMFPYEKLYFSAKDKAEIENLPEIRRESILADRTQQLERHDQDVTLRRLLAARAKDEAKASEKKKRKAGAADLEESQRKSSRQRTKLGGGKVGEADSAIEAYKRQRAEKGLRDEQRRKDAAAKKELGVQASPDNNYSDADAEGESEVEYDDKKYKRTTPTPPRDDPIAELADIQRAKVGRDNFAQVCYYPGFEEAIKDCYARVCLGPGRTPGVNEYRLCLIKGFEKGKPYAMMGSNGRPFPVDNYIMAAHGKATRAWSFLECSMSRFTEEEWRRYRVTMANEDCKLPTRRFVNNKLDQINALINHRFTEAEITEKIKRQNDLLKTVNRVDERNKIEARKALAIEADDEEAIAACDDELTALIPIKMAYNTTLVKPENNHVNKEQERLAELNRRNQRLNAENVRKAQLAEMKAKKAKTHLAPGVDDLFEGGSDISRSGTPVNGVGTPKNIGTPRSSTPVNLLRPVQKDKKGIPTIRKAALDDEVLAKIDLGIEIDI